jgi:hypothetical protein
MKGDDTGIQNQPPIAVQVRATGWRYEDRWPLPDTQFTKFFFHSPDGGRAGTLDTIAPEDESPTVYHYDPADPVVTLGANGSHESISGLIANNPVDHRSKEVRQDVLVFTSDVLTSDLTVVGPVEAVLHASSSAPDTDFTVTLLEVWPDGPALNVTEGLVRARFRESIWEPPTLINPGQIYEFKVTLLPASIKFRRGNRIRVHVSSSSWPLWDRNQNTGNPIGMDAEIQVAEQTLYHDRHHPSYIVLRIVGGGDEGGTAPVLGALGDDATPGQGKRG